MVGQGVLRECLLDPEVENVLAIVRNSSLPHHDKLREIVHQDVSDLSAIEDRKKLPYGFLRTTQHVHTEFGNPQRREDEGKAKKTRLSGLSNSEGPSKT